jgi:predicted secreted protein
LNTITKEAAQGSGERMDALAEVLGCSEEGTEALRQLCKDKHESIFNSNDSKMVLSTLREEIKANENVASNCDRA